MKIQNLIKNAFTLVEVLVSITIFGIMSISIVWIYITSSEITLRADINRMMQENLKNVSNKITEDIRRQGILGISSSNIDSCNFSVGSNNYKEGDKLCINGGNKYYLAKENPLNGEFLRVTTNDCSGIEDHCVIAKGISEPLTNSYVSVKKLDFYLSKDYIPKVTINIVLQPSTKKGLKQEVIKESKLIFQTTISERPF